MVVFEDIIFKLALVFTGASLLATVFLYFRQPIILAYIALGILMGPWGAGVLKNPALIGHISQLGIILLMFLLGLHLHPQKLYKLLKETALITVGTGLVFTALIMPLAMAFGFPPFDGLLIGLALTFSSTVIVLKLVPTTALHHRHMGEVLISILLFQDILAIILLLFLSVSMGANVYLAGIFLILKTMAFALCCFFAVSYGLLKIFRRFDVIQDYLFLMSLGWCLLGAAAAKLLGLSYEIGAFIAGISLGASPIALIIAEGLKPVREFFLILFFFSIGATFDFSMMGEILVPGLILAGMVVVLKPIFFSLAFKLTSEPPRMADELGTRLGQASEFSLFVAYGALASGKIAVKTSSVIQLATIVTFIVSTYLVVYRYPTPIALSDTMRQD
jgi:Kef-type K+ transport system membrane component KefB